MDTETMTASKAMEAYMRSGVALLIFLARAATTVQDAYSTADEFMTQLEFDLEPEGNEP